MGIRAGQAGQTKDAVILCHQLRTVDLGRVTAFEIAGHVQYVTDPRIRKAVRGSLAHHLGLDLPTAIDGGA